jgi:class 3 adenylate cyclase
MKQAFEVELGRLATEVPEWRPGLVDLDLRIAVHTGEVIIAPAAQAIGAGQKTVLGEGVSEAQRMLARVPAGEVRVSRTTHRLVEAQFVWDAPISEEAAQGFRPQGHVPSDRHLARRGGDW